MSSPPNQLDELQRWMLASITAREDAARGVEENILPSRQQSAAERLAVYSHAYFARLLEVLRELLPCTRSAVGDELFDRFAVGYLQTHPPHSYTLARLADKFAEYLDATRPADWGEFVVELVRLELAIDRIFDGPGPEALSPLTIPTNAGGALRLTVVPGFELHAFGHPVSDYYTRWKRGEEPAWPEPRQQFVALFRRDYIVRRYELSGVQFQLLRQIAGGLRLEEALQKVAEANDGEELASDVSRWFEFWARERIFATASC
jgi:hypothetical protein